MTLRGYEQLVCGRTQKLVSLSTCLLIWFLTGTLTKHSIFKSGGHACPLAVMYEVPIIPHMEKARLQLALGEFDPLSEPRVG